MNAVRAQSARAPHTSDRQAAVSSRACIAAVGAPAQVFPRSVRSSSCVSQPIAASLLALVPGAPRGPRMGESGRGPAPPRSSARNGGPPLFSPAGPPRAGRGDPGRRHSSRKAKKCLACRPPLRCGPSAAPRVRFDRLRPVDRHRGRDGRGPTRHRRVQWRPSAASRSPRTATMPAR